MALNPNLALPVDVCLTAGQSNMSGTPGAYQNPPAPATTAGLCWDYRATGGTTFVQVSDPSSSDSVYKANNGSCIPTFANTFTARSGRSIVFVRAARGGTALLAANDGGLLSNGNWDTSGNCFPDSVTRLQAAITAIEGQGHTIGHVFVIWSQGGRDAQGGQDLELYEAANAALVDRWRTALSIPTLQVFMEELSSVQGGEGALADEIALIRAAENAAASYTDGLHMAFNEGKDYVNRPGWMRPSDGIHYMQVGLNYMGQKMSNYAADHYGFAESSEPEPPAVPTGQVSLVARRLMASPPLPPLPREWSAPGPFSWTCPQGVTSVDVETWGAGGGGRGGVSLGRGGMGGGGGEYRYLTSYAVTPGVTYSITVGAGGTGSSFNSNNGSAGTASSFDGVLTANGGGTPPAANTVGAGGTGGTGGTGEAGQPGGASANTTNSEGGTGGKAGGTEGGAGGAGGTSAAPPGLPGTTPGGGGGGGRGNIGTGTGGNGAPGRVRISAP